MNKTPLMALRDVKSLYLMVIVIVGLINTSFLLREIFNLEKRHQGQHLSYFSGLRFQGLEKILEGEEYIGYFTDKDLSVKQNVAQFSQAQYILAPIILDLNNTNHRFIIFDCSTPVVAFKKIKEIHATPLKRNNYGIILARTK